MRGTGIPRGASQRRAVRSVQCRNCPIDFQPTSRRPTVPPLPAPSRLVPLSTKLPPRRLSEPWTPFPCAAPQHFLCRILRFVPVVVISWRGGAILAVRRRRRRRRSRERSTRHKAQRARRRGRTREGSGRRRARGGVGARVLNSYSHRSRMMHVGHFGARAVHV